MEWISVKDKLPNSTEEIVLAYINNEIYMGRFFAYEFYKIGVNGSRTDYEKKIIFSPVIWLDNIYCDLCEIDSNCHHNHCVNCCEQENEISSLILSFNLDEITHWMPLPQDPKY